MESSDVTEWADAVDQLERANIRVRKAKEVGNGELIAFAMQKLDEANSRYARAVALFCEIHNRAFSPTSRVLPNDKSPLLKKAGRSE